jgi:hypothetical protein
VRATGEVDIVEELLVAFEVLLSTGDVFNGALDARSSNPQIP